MALEFVVFYVLALVTTTLVAFVPGVVRARAPVSLPLDALALALAAWVAVIVLRDAAAAVILGLVAVMATVATRALLRGWSWSAAQVFATMVLASLAYLVYAGLQTYAGGLGPVAEVLSTVLLTLEIAVLALSLSYTYEVLDVLGRRRPALVRPASRTCPWVALQVPTYNEPPELVIRTLESLARIDYPHLIVQVVDNNTKDPALWRPLQDACKRLGPAFHFLHLEPWPGFKAGALNEATRRLPTEVAVIGIVDADYLVEPDFLQATVGHFDDPRVAFVQTSQHYREWEDDRYLRGLFYSFRYFFDVTMPVRAHRNAIIFCGTMGLIRRSAIEEIGGWNETCITEDAEASLRILGRGHLGVYDPATYGAGLMPLNFDGLKKQRFRWALGGIQILRQWWRELVPFTTHRLRLTGAQRVHYLLGSVQWFGEVLTACFTVLLLATAMAAALHHQLPLRQLTGAVLMVPVAFASTGLLRALWAMRLTTGCTAGDALRAMRVWFALSWVVTLACLRGVVSERAEFLRTPKRRDEGTLLRALRFARTETVLAGCAVGAGVAMDVRSPALATAALSVLLVGAAGVYSSAPWASLAAEGIPLTPLRRIFAQSPQNTGDRPTVRPATAAVGGAAVGFAAGMGVALALVVTSPSDRAPFSSGGANDLPTIGSLTPSISRLPGTRPSTTDSPRPAAAPVRTAAASPSTPRPTGATPPGGAIPSLPPSPAGAPSGSPMTSPAPTATPSPSARPSTTARPSASAAASPGASAPATVSPTPPPSPAPRPSATATAPPAPRSTTPTPTP